MRKSIETLNYLSQAKTNPTSTVFLYSRGMNIATWLKESRKSAGMTLEQMGDVVSRTKGAISQWEKGDTEPSYWQIIAIYERTNRAVPLPSLDDAPVEIQKSVIGMGDAPVSEAARGLINAIADADRNGLPPRVLTAISELIKSFPSSPNQRDDGDLPHLQP